MNKIEITDKVSRVFGKSKLFLKQNAPEILMVTGLVAGGIGVIMACAATTKINDVIDDSKKKLDAVKDNFEKGEVKRYSSSTEDCEPVIVEYTDKMRKKDTTKIYAYTVLKLAQIYGPSLAIFAVSSGCIITSNELMKKRVLALASAYATVEQSFKEYRSRVIERFGEDIEKEIRYDIKEVEVECTTIDENGNEVTSTKTVKIIGDKGIDDPYAKIFDELNPNHKPNSDYNEFFIRAQQNVLNDRLRAQGYLTLNEAYVALGFKPTQAGMVVGWIYDVDGNETGDNHIDFGLDNFANQSAQSFLAGEEDSVIISFNVDGNIYDRVTDYIDRY